MFTINLGDTLHDRYQVDSPLPSLDKLVRYYLARDTLLDRLVVVKFLTVLDDNSLLERFKLEAQVIARLEHPHVVPIYDYGVYQNHPYQIQRYLSGGNLREYLSQHGDGMTILGALNLTQQLGSALAYIHGRGIAHRDLSPKNIVLDEQLQPYLTNFALAAINHDPTIHMKQPNPTNINTDLYEFGLLLYQIFTGRIPEIERDSIKQPVRELRPDLPIGVELVIDRLTRKQSSIRYKSAVQAINALYQAFYSGQSKVEGRVFISYGRKDKDYVYLLVKELRRIGLDIWIDLDIPPGDNWDKAIEDALNGCNKMLLIVSPASMISENVQDEWSFFLEQGKPVYPFLYQETELSFRLRRRQFINSTGDFLTDISRIVDTLAGGKASELNSNWQE